MFRNQGIPPIIYSLTITDEVIQIADDYGFNFVVGSSMNTVSFEPDQKFVFKSDPRIKLNKMLLDDLLMVIKTIPLAFHEMKCLAEYESKMLGNE